MNQSITVSVPTGQKLPYSLYTRGALTGTPAVDPDGSYTHFVYSGKSVFICFYTFKKFRRAYILYKGGSITLPGVEERVTVIFDARGRNVDHLKRVVYLLTRKSEKVFLFPRIFWYKIASAIQFYDGKRSDIMLLYEQYKGGSRNEHN